MLRALDLFCSAGGATRGLQLAGFHVTGVDIAPQPNYGRGPADLAIAIQHHELMAMFSCRHVSQDITS